MPASAKQSRLEARLSGKQKAAFQKAAALQGSTLAEFVIGAAMEKAERVIREREVVEIAEQDRRRFFEGLRAAPEPNRALQKALRGRKRLIQP